MIDNQIQELKNDIRVYSDYVKRYLETHNYIDDLDETVTQEEVDRLIAYEKGDAMRVTIVKMDGSSFTVIVYKSATVNHLKLAIRDFLLHQLPKGNNTRISWTYVWKKYCLECENGLKLLDNRNYLKDFSIHDGSVLRMGIKPIRRRVKRPRQQNQKKRFFNPNLRR